MIGNGGRQHAQLNKKGISLHAYATVKSPLFEHPSKMLSLLFPFVHHQPYRAPHLPYLTPYLSPPASNSSFTHLPPDRFFSFSSTYVSLHLEVTDQDSLLMPIKSFLSLLWLFTPSDFDIFNFLHQSVLCFTTFLALCLGISFLEGPTFEFWQQYCWLVLRGWKELLVWEKGMSTSKKILSNMDELLEHTKKLS